MMPKALSSPTARPTRALRQPLPYDAPRHHQARGLEESRVARLHLHGFCSTRQSRQVVLN